MKISSLFKKNERYFKTEVVASLVEVCYLGGFDYNEIFKLASFITKENIDVSNIKNYRDIIMSELTKLYPDIKRHIFLSDCDIKIDICALTLKPDMNKELYESFNICETPKIVEYYKKYYKEKYGDFMLIKSIDKNYVKKLTYKNTN